MDGTDGSCRTFNLSHNILNMMSTKSHRAYILLIVFSFFLLKINAATQASNLRGITEDDDFTEDAMKDLVTDLPGLVTTPKFKIFSGYLTLSSTFKSNMFYLYVEAEINPENAPVVWWTNGGPGCSGLIGFGVEHGPFIFEKDGSLAPNSYSWNKLANMLYVEQPIGVGFSYRIADDSVTSNDENDDEDMGDFFDDIKATSDNYEALQKFFEKFPNRKSNSFYLASESYGGHYVPHLAKAILERDTEKEINFKGFSIGNPYVDPFSNHVAEFESYYSHGLVPKVVHDQWYSKCTVQEMYDFNSFECQTMEENMKKMMGNEIDHHSLDFPICVEDNPNQTSIPATIHQQLALLRRFHPDRVLQTLLPVPNIYDACVKNYVTTYLNRQDVQSALHVTNPTIWDAMNYNVHDTYSVEDFNTPQVALYEYFVSAMNGQQYVDLDIIIYSGDDDQVCPTSGTQSWLFNLGVKPIESEFWKLWEVDNQTAGYVTTFEMERGSLRFATVRGAGHEVPAYQPERAFELFKRYLSGRWVQ